MDLAHAPLVVLILLNEYSVSITPFVSTAEDFNRAKDSSVVPKIVPVRGLVAAVEFSLSGNPSNRAV
jgi:hypothetical protein